MKVSYDVRDSWNSVRGKGNAYCDGECGKGYADMLLRIS